MEACSSRFTAAEGGARLAAAASARNTLAVEYASFVATRLVHEDAYKIRGPLFEGRQRSVYVTRASRVKVVAYELNILTDLAVAQALTYDDIDDWPTEINEKEVLVCTSSVLKRVLADKLLHMTVINVLILDSCHLVARDESLQFIMKHYKECDEEKRPRILALTYPLFASTKKESETTNDTEKLPEIVENQETINIDDTNLKTKEETTDVNTDALESKVEASDSTAESDEGIATDLKYKEKNKAVEEMGAYENLDDFEMYEKLEWKIEELEKDLCCQMDLAEDIDGGKRFSSTVIKPKELIIEYKAAQPAEQLTPVYLELDNYMRTTVGDATRFIHEHRYDPTEIYGEDLYEEFKSIPDPTIEPISVFTQFIYVLDQLGPYAADKAAFSLLTKLEKLKIKVPYERHFLLLCLCTSVFVKIRCYADIIFSKYDTDWEKIQKFCTPKVLRFAEILEKFQPPELGQNKNSTISTAINKGKNPIKTNDMLNELDKCDFLTLSNKIEDKVNAFEANLKDLDATIPDTIINDNNKSANANNVHEDNITNAGDANEKNDNENSASMEGNTEKVVDIKSMDVLNQKGLGFARRAGQRSRGRGRLMRNNASRLQQQQQSADALCGIVFMKEPLMAKIMFMLLTDMSRSNPKLSYLCVQYCAVENPADPGVEPKECQRQSKKQEEVLKKFRMHECNLLLATSALEEGIDLPRCNLVLRWDLPASYRSYGLCRSRARAPRASCALLSCGADCTHTLLGHVAVYRELDQIISRKCGCGIQNEPPQSEEDHADNYTPIVKSYTPSNLTNNIDKEKNIETKKVYNQTENAIINKEEEVISDINNEYQKDISISKTNNIENEIENMETPNEHNHTKVLKIDKKTNQDTTNIVKNGVSNVECKCNEKSKVNCECQSVNRSEVTTSDKKLDSDIASVDLSTAIALINRYCGKLPSDTFTRLAPQWWMEEVELPVRGATRTAYICTLRLPLNCPLKYHIVGHPMPTRVLARRMVALQACRILHKSGELDDQLMPIGKENFKAADLDTTQTLHNGDLNDPNDSARPGTTKRRQYYYKRTAWAFTDCQPVIDTSDTEIDGPDVQKNESPRTNVDDAKEKKDTKRNMLYAIVSKLWCALPERYNTRGRRLHAPQHASQAMGILMARDEPDNLQIPAFPVYTRSGEVRVSVEHVPGADVRMSPRRGRLVRRFMRFVFAEVLRVRRRGMRLQREPAHRNNYYIVPTLKTIKEDGSSKIDIDWQFLELIYQHTEEKKLSDIEKPVIWNQEEDSDVDDSTGEKEKKEKVKKMLNPLLKDGEVFVFDPEKYREAVVTPWYRNQDQPQFFLVAEICNNLTPDSAFPSATHSSFRDYYTNKYGVTLTQPNQPLLDVDHTSARLNLLTPRYVNRKGVALPVSSERTRRAKRDRLDQKQILVPELCRVHPIAAPLWFATVALPCVLYRINALLIADEIRRAVAIDVGLGIPKIDEKTMPGFQWPPLHFGWSLAEVLSADSEKNEKKIEEELETMKKVEDDVTEELKEENEEQPKTLNEILQKEVTDNAFEIGTWSNEMASSIPQSDYDEYMEPLPSNLTFCTSASGGANWCDPVEKPKSQYNPTKGYSMADSDCSYMSSDFDTDDSDFNTEGSDDDTDTSGFCSSYSNAAMGVRIEYKTAHEAEAVDLERKKKTKPAPQPDEEDDALDRAIHDEFIRSGTAPAEYIEKFRHSVALHKADIINKGHLITEEQQIQEILPEAHVKLARTDKDLEDIATRLSKLDFKIDDSNKELLTEIFPYGKEEIKFENGQITLESIERNKRLLLDELKKSLSMEEIKKLNCFSMVDVDIDSPDYVNEKLVNVGFDTKESYMEKIKSSKVEDFKPYYQESKGDSKVFDFDYQPKLEGHPGPSPSVILQALTMSNANDGINLERLETIGDSFLKFAITAYLYCAHPTVHEGKLSHMRSKQVSNLNLYRLGRNKRLGARMIASKFEPHDNWLPPCHKPPSTLHPRMAETEEQSRMQEPPPDTTGCFIPYNLITQHSIPDKSIADCVEALIGAYLLECGPRGALLFMSWLGIRVLPRHDLPLSSEHEYVRAHHEPPQPPPPPPKPQRHNNDSDASTSDDEDEPSTQEQWFPADDWSWPTRPVGSLRPYRDESGQWRQPIFGELKAPPSPLLRYIEDPEGELERMLSGYDALERTLQYRFKDRSLLLQALTHASHLQNKLTDCYQRLEFLGDAILDYLITRHLYEDPRRHSPGALTDLRSALVNNTIFATLAARHSFHKYFRHMSPGLNEVLTKYVKIQEENGHSISEEHYLIQEDEMEQAEDVEVPKALGDLFESVAGAIFLDSGMSLGAVWKSYLNLMGAELEAFSAAAPKSPVRELLEAEPDTAKFGKPERLADGRRVRVCVEVFGRGAFKGVGRNYRIAKGTAARCALRHLRGHRR